MKGCATERGHDFCGQCNDYPCQELREFQAKYPHRLELWESQARIAEAGYEIWYTEMLDNYACPNCGSINSAYDIKCRHCGAVFENEKAPEKCPVCGMAKAYFEIEPRNY